MIFLNLSNFWFVGIISADSLTGGSGHGTQVAPLLPHVWGTPRGREAMMGTPVGSEVLLQGDW